LNQNSFLVSVADLFIISIYGGTLFYVSHFIIPLSTTEQLGASAFLAFTLGSLGPEVDEIVEWILFFALGIFAASIVPQFNHYMAHGTYDLNNVLLAFKQALPYSLQILSPWTLMLPLGLAFHKMSHKKYYHHPRFF